MHMALVRARIGLQQGTDRNGNWIAVDALAQVIVDQRAASAARANGLGGHSRTPMEDLIRERGVGTAGVGWSPDGTFLYAGTEQGIFEFRVNVRDRMQFPSLEMR